MIKQLDVYIEGVISRQNEGRIAGLSRGVAIPVGTRSKIFQFNEFSRAGEVKEPAPIAEGNPHKALLASLQKLPLPSAPFWRTHGNP